MVDLSRPRRSSARKLALVAVALALAQPAWAGKAAAAEALVAVAANFTDVVNALKQKFVATSGHQLTITTGSTGKLYAQITNGAPYDILLAADERRPMLLEKSSFGVPESRFTYAVGRLALWSADAALIGQDGAATLRTGRFRHLAIANPKLAPYGAAAKQALEALGVWGAVQGRIVQGENIGQVFSMVSTGNAELGFVALSYVVNPRNPRKGSRWDVPADLYRPIRQDAVLLAHGRDNAAAKGFLTYLRTAETRRLIATFGYGAD
jgi:molybdate transport system substrate-binding protein